MATYFILGPWREIINAERSENLSVQTILRRGLNIEELATISPGLQR
jgi:hypothetical protein